MIQRDGDSQVNPVFSPPTPGEYTSAHETNQTTQQDTVLATQEMSKEELDATLSTTIQEDRGPKLILFYGTILNYTETDQFNFAVTSPPSVGKSHLTSQVLSYFPEEDILDKGYVTPTAFFYENSKLCTSDRDPLPNRSRYVEQGIKEWEKQNPFPSKGDGRERWKENRALKQHGLKAEWDEIDKWHVIDLSRKVLHFFDMPNDKLLQNLRPMLSHDKRIIEHNMTDKSKEGGNRTIKVLIIGFPTVIFNSVFSSRDEQEQHRFILLSPQVSQNKLRKTLRQITDAKSDTRKYLIWFEGDHQRYLLKIRVRMIKESQVRNVIIREADADYLLQTFFERHPVLMPRHQRDYARLIALAKSHALFNQWTRETTEEGTTIYATRHDIDEALELFDPVLRSNERGLPPIIDNFYEDCLKPALEEHPEGLSYHDVSRLYSEFYQVRIGVKALKNLVELLLETGFIIEETDPDDRRRKRLFHSTGGGEKKVDILSKASLGDILIRILDALGDDPQSVDDLGKQLGVPVDRATRMLRLLEQDGVAFHTLDDKWRRE